MKRRPNVLPAHVRTHRLSRRSWIVWVMDADRLPSVTRRTGRIAHTLRITGSHSRQPSDSRRG